MPDGDPLPQRGPDTDPRSLPYLYTPGQVCAGRYVYAVFQYAVVIDGSAGIQDTRAADYGPGIHDHASEDD